MSYDLFFKQENKAFSLEEFESFFTGRKNYTLQGTQAWYQNQDTGVYFVFEYQEEDSGDDEFHNYPVAFNMNYLRPSYFVNEAEPEVREFVNRFSFSIDDPQMDGMGTGEFSSEKFIQGWLSGNEFGYSSILKDNPCSTSLPSDVLNEMWKWNYHKSSLQDSVTDDVFVPRIMLLSYQGNTVTAAVWPDAIPSIIPKVDILLIGRKELAPRRLFKKVEDMAIGKWEVLVPFIEAHKNKMQNNGYYLNYTSVPQDLKKAISKIPPSKDGDLIGISYDQVLNRELVEKYS